MERKKAEFLHFCGHINCSLDIEHPRDHKKWKHAQESCLAPCYRCAHVFPVKSADTTQNTITITSTDLDPHVPHS